MALIDSVSRAGAGATAAIDTTGATMLVAVVSGGVPAGGVSDSKGNTWVERTAQGSIGNDSETSIWDCLDPTSVGSGHTFSVAAGGGAPSICVEAHSGGPWAFDDESGVTEEATPVKPGALTPTEDGSLVVTGVGGICQNSTVDAPFTLTENVDVVGGTNYGTAIAHYYQATAAAVDPEWTIGGPSFTQAAAVMVVYKPSSAATSYTFEGPTSGALNIASTNFTVTPNGDASGITVTPASDGTGTFTPSSVTFTGSSPETFTYTPTSTAGSPHTLSVTDDGGLTDPASIDYAVSAVSIAVCLGDSFTAGAALAAEERWPAVLEGLLGASWLTYNEGIGGNTLDQMEARIDTDVVPLLVGSPTNVVFLYGGINNISPFGSNESAATAYAKLQSCVAALRLACPEGTLIFVWELPPATDATYLSRRNAFNTLIQDEASPGWDAVVRASLEPYGLDGAAGDSTWYAGDEHPNATLAALYADIAYDTLNAELNPSGVIVSCFESAVFN